MKETIVYQNGQPVPVLPCLQRPDFSLRVREGAVIQIDVTEESSLRVVYRLPLGPSCFRVTLVEECEVSCGKEFLVTCEAGTRKENPLCSFGKFSFLLSALEAHQAVIDQPEMLLDCWDESPDLVVVGGRVVQGQGQGQEETKQQSQAEQQELDLWKQLDNELHNELHTQTQPDRDLLRDVQNLLHDAWDSWGGEEGLTDREIIALVGLRVVGTLLKKNADYGCSVWKPPVLVPDIDPLKAMLCRTSDKIERIATLAAGRLPQVVGEGLKDSVLDMAGYSILMLGWILKQELAAGKWTAKGARHGEV